MNPNASLFALVSLLLAALVVCSFVPSMLRKPCQPAIVALPSDEASAVAYRLQTCGDSVILLNQDTVLRLEPLAKGDLK